jgi:hypothetical protein
MDHDHAAKGTTLKALRITVAILAAMALAGCGRIFKDKDVAEKAVAHFHDQYNQGQIEEIWKDADPAFTSAAPRLGYGEFMGSLQRKLGKVVSTSNVGWHVNFYNQQTTVRLVQETVFEHGNGTESFAFTINGTNAVLLGYHVESGELNLDHL